MPQFKEFNTENKLRVPLSAYAAQIIENDCMNFSRKKTTLINTIIMNYYPEAECSISLRLKEYKEELTRHLGKRIVKQNEALLNSILENRAEVLSKKYVKRLPSDVNWQITLNKKVKVFLTEDSFSCEEQYYGNKPGRYVRALMESYAQLPYHRREEIVFKQLINVINSAINEHRVISLTNTRGSHIALKPYKISTDPMSMYHYLIGYNTNYTDEQSEKESIYNPPVMSIRISRLVNAEIQYLQSGIITPQEEQQIIKEIGEKTVPFLSGKSAPIKVWLSDNGINKYEAQLHLRPPVVNIDPNNRHIYTFECTETQILYYFFSFGKEAIILSPETLASTFRQNYEEALENYAFEDQTNSF